MHRTCIVCHESKIPEDYIAATAIVCSRCMGTWRPKRLVSKTPKYRYRKANREYYSLQRFLRKWAGRLDL